MVQCLPDRGNFFLVTGFPVGVVFYSTVACVRSAKWTVALLCIIFAQVSYAILAFNFPDKWQVDFGEKMWYTMFALMVTVVALAAVATWVVVLVAVLVFAGPVLYQNALVVASAVRSTLGVNLPDWGACLVLAVLIVILLAVLHVSKLLQAMHGAIQVVFASVYLFVCIRLASIEYGTYGPVDEPSPFTLGPPPPPPYRPPPDAQPAPFLGNHFARLGICCGDGTDADRCPLALTNWAFNGVLVLLLVVLGYATCCGCRSSRAATERAKDGKGRPAPVPRTA